MTTSTIGRPHARQVRAQVAAHRYEVGQVVQIKSGLARTQTPATTYHVTATLPPRGNALQYRIRNDEERHERVVTQDDIEPAGDQQTPSTLMERTFGHG
ncbi:hypothetical protein [Rhizobium sp. EC-SD404]|uniref:hypothetical protein n=1 Tax=Rhizobium sp. EC-SD404 TaxID=2038389 RepID=UPI001258B5CC|nr:hypothetical protein [Rhizobium sp. EC-SD404]VVT07876.1 conserved hypothetical protein [Rhizobium sp. EC-SD404]